MPAESKSQQRFMGMVHGLQKGTLKSDDVGKKVRDAAKKMKPQDAKDFAETKHKGLPETKEASTKPAVPTGGSPPQTPSAPTPPQPAQPPNEATKAASVLRRAVIGLATFQDEALVKRANPAEIPLNGSSIKG